MKRRKHKREDKTITQREHFKRRLRERYGISINRHEYREIVEWIQEAPHKNRLEQQSNRVTVWLVPIQGVNVPVVYDKQRKTAVSALPTAYLEERVNT